MKIFSIIIMSVILSTNITFLYAENGAGIIAEDTNERTEEMQYKIVSSFYVLLMTSEGVEQREVDPDEAIKEARIYLKKYPNGKHAATVQQFIAFIYQYHKKDYTQAIKEFDKLIQNYPENETLVDAAHSAKARLQNKIRPWENDVYEGMPKEDLYKVLSDLQQQEIEWQKDGDEEWITFRDWTTKASKDVIIFYLVAGKVKGWERHLRLEEEHSQEIRNSVRSILENIFKDSRYSHEFGYGGGPRQIAEGLYLEEFGFGFVNVKIKIGSKHEEYYNSFFQNFIENIKSWEDYQHVKAWCTSSGFMYEKYGEEYNPEKIPGLAYTLRDNSNDELYFRLRIQFINREEEILLINCVSIYKAAPK